MNYDSNCSLYLSSSDVPDVISSQPVQGFPSTAYSDMVINLSFEKYAKSRTDHQEPAGGEDTAYGKGELNHNSVARYGLQ